MPKKPRFGVDGSADGSAGGAGAEEVEAIGDEADLALGNSTANRLFGEDVWSLEEGENGGWLDS